MQQNFIPKAEFDRILKSSFPSPWDRLQLFSTMCRLNTLFEVKRAGSGHLGTSFSAMDIVAYLYLNKMNVLNVGIDHPDRDIYFSSKGHDAPGLYAILYALGVVAEEKFLALRRLGGLDGHPDNKIAGVEANTGSLGMGISKGRGMAFAKKFLNRKGRVYVLTGDGEWQEGQNFEALQATVQQGRTDLTVIMDHNKLQSDRLIDRIVSLGDLEAKISSFGWHVERCDGHSFSDLDRAFARTESITDKPSLIICDTIKGKGIRFMEHPVELESNGGFYRWHSGAPDDASYEKGFQELTEEIRLQCEKLHLPPVQYVTASPENKPKSSVSDEVIAVQYGQAVLRQASKNEKFIVLDADLSFDCKLREFEDQYPARFVECGIAEQDMVSMAAGIAAQGLVPVVHSFANFLAARANEQIYNALSEGKKMVFACHYSGLIPAGPGKSHQSIRDISLFGAFPNCEILQAANGEEMALVVDYALNRARESCMIRINIGPSPTRIAQPSRDYLIQGQGVTLTEGRDAVVFSYGPVMLHEVLSAASQLSQKAGLRVKVVNMPFLNRFDESWLLKTIGDSKTIVFVEDHAPFGGLGDHMVSFLQKRGHMKGKRVVKYGVEGFPACGTPWQVLDFHGLSADRLAERMALDLKN